jgi:hypothetical protein
VIRCLIEDATGGRFASDGELTLSPMVKPAADAR